MPIAAICPSTPCAWPRAMQARAHERAIEVEFQQPRRIFRQHGFQPAFQRQCFQRRFAPPAALYACAQLDDYLHRHIARLGRHPLEKIGHARRRCSRPCALQRSHPYRPGKPAWLRGGARNPHRSPTSGMPRKISSSGRFGSGRKALRRMSRCSSSMLRPCARARLCKAAISNSSVSVKVSVSGMRDSPVRDESTVAQSARRYKESHRKACASTQHGAARWHSTDQAGASDSRRTSSSHSSRGMVAGSKGSTPTVPCQANACPSRLCGSPRQSRLI